MRDSLPGQEEHELPGSSDLLVGRELLDSCTGDHELALDIAGHLSGRDVATPVTPRCEFVEERLAELRQLAALCVLGWFVGRRTEELDHRPLEIRMHLGQVTRRVRCPAAVRICDREQTAAVAAVGDDEKQNP